MPSQYPYRVTIRNDYLKSTKVIRAMTQGELHWLVEDQHAKWAAQESQKRQREQDRAAREANKQLVENLKTRAEADTADAQARIQRFRSILASAAGVRPLPPSWDSLLDNRSFRPFSFQMAKPDRDQIRLELLGAGPGPAPTEEDIRRTVHIPERRPVLEMLLPFLRHRREAEENKVLALLDAAIKKNRDRMRAYRAQEGEVVKAFNARVMEYNAALAREKDHYLRERKEFLTKQREHNGAVMAFRARFESGTPDAVERFVEGILAKLPYAEDLTGDPDVQFDEHSRTLVVNYWLPGIDDLPKITEYKFVASRKEIRPVEMKKKDFDSFYDDVIHQIA